MSPFTLFILTVMCGAMVLIVDACCDARRGSDLEAPAARDGQPTEVRAHHRSRRHEDPRR